MFQSFNFFPQHIVEGLLNFCRRECVVVLGGIGLRRSPRGNGTGVIIVIVIVVPLRLCLKINTNFDYSP